MVANSLAVGRVCKCQIFRALSALPVTAALSVVIIDVCEGCSDICHKSIVVGKVLPQKKFW